MSYKTGLFGSCLSKTQILNSDIDLSIMIDGVTYIKTILKYTIKLLKYIFIFFTIQNKRKRVKENERNSLKII